MKHCLSRPCMALFLSIALLCGQFPAVARAAPADAATEAPSVSEPASPEEPEPPEESLPEESVPDASLPEESLPEESVPDESVPDESVPDESVPDESVPDESLPDESVPDESVPDESIPDESLPEESVPDESVPEESVPGESVPDESLPDASAPAEPAGEILSAFAQPPVPAGPGLYFGQIHAHTAISDGAGTPAEVFAMAAQREGLDFFAVTDHSHSFRQHLAGQIGTDAAAVSQDWAEGKAAAAAATSDAFLALFGYEMSWPGTFQIGHISTFGSPGFQSWEQEGYNKYTGALTRYYETLASLPEAVSQFNHPGFQYGTFEDFEYSPAADQVISLLELADFQKDIPAHYVKALDQGWHLAPTGGPAERARTVVYAQSLTEEAIYDALGCCRAYATEDPDLEVLYSLDGHFMGSRLDLGQTGPDMDISVEFRDPSDTAVGLVEVITNGGASVAQASLSSGCGTLFFSVPASPGYYFLRITQPDGDMAVTAPVWVEGAPDLGIGAFTSETPAPVQNEELVLNLELYNREETDFLVESVKLYADDAMVAACDLARIGANASISIPLTLRLDCVGPTRLYARLTGRLNGTALQLEASLDLTFHQSRQITSVLVDGSHGSAGLDQLESLKQLALSENIDLMVSVTEPSAEDLKKHRFLLVGPPSQPFSDAFLAAVSGYVQYGGSLVVCGQGRRPDQNFDSAAELNRLLAAADSTMQIRDDCVTDPVNGGTDSALLFPDQFNRESPWCGAVSENQIFRFFSGASVDPGRGVWLVKASDTARSSLTAETAPVLLACEAAPGGGTVFASGCLFAEDQSLALPQSIWGEVYANRTIAQSLLGIGGEPVPLSTVLQAREGAKNELFRIRGYVTAGNSNPFNTFPDTIYLQDETGGIAVTPLAGLTVQQGTAVEVTGFADIRQGNRVLKPESVRILDAPAYQFLPAAGSWTSLLDYSQNGGRLVQAEGECQEIYCWEEGTMAGCLLMDKEGNLARIWIEEGIGNGSDGKNELHKFTRKGRVIRAAGLLHIDEYGNTVIRVRNCEEVVYVPPKILPGMNPPTADGLPSGIVFCLIGSVWGLLQCKRKHRTSG